jgi:hypothetical protein
MSCNIMTSVSVIVTNSRLDKLTTKTTSYNNRNEATRLDGPTQPAGKTRGLLCVNRAFLLAMAS